MIDEQETLKIKAIRPAIRVTPVRQYEKQDILRLISVASILLCIAFALFLTIQLPKTTEMWDKIMEATPTQVSCVHVLWVNDGQNNNFVNDYHCSNRR